MVEYRKYDFTVTINGIAFDKVWIDPHYEEKHSVSINDLLILKLVKLLDGFHDRNVEQWESVFVYFTNDLELEGKWYRLVWLIPPGLSYIGVRNAYRLKTIGSSQ